MIDITAKYIYEVYRCKSVSLAAKKLFLSQPALSTSIKKAERELGAPIFNRKTIPFSLTAEGKLYIEAIEKMMQLEQETKAQIQDISELKNGTLKIGTAYRLSYFVIPQICEVFRREFPHVDISIIHTHSDMLLSLLEKNDADLIFTPIDKTYENLHTEILFEEKCIVALRRDFHEIEHLLPYALSYNEIVSRRYPPEKEIEDVELFQNIEFIYSPPNSNIYKKRKSVLSEFKTDPYVTSSLGNQQLNYNLMMAGFGALFTTDAVIATMPPNTDCLYFALRAPEAKQNFALVYKEQEHSGSAAILQAFAGVAKDLFHNEMPLQTLCLYQGINTAL